MAGAQSKRPKDSSFRQQRLAAWQPILTPAWVIGTFLVTGIIFVPIGIIIISASNSVAEFKVTYAGDGKDDSSTCQALSNGDDPAECTATITPDVDMEPPIYMYYELTNFYQNHRRYVKSRSDAQLRGDLPTAVSSLEDCDPLAEVDGEDGDDPSKFYYPCGLIANSFFNDQYAMAEGTDPVPLKREGIAWPSDLDAKFKDPDVPIGTLPPRLEAEFGSYANFSVTNEDFVVWMRVAGLPTFRKLKAIIEQPLAADTPYSFTIQNKFPTADFSGTKSIVLSTTSWLGGKNSFLGTAYVIVGFVALAIGFIFLLKHIYSPRKLGDPSYLVWPR